MNPETITVPNELAQNLKVAEKFIKGEPEIGNFAVHQDHPDRERIENQPTEDASQREGTVYFDIRSVAVIPQSGELIQILVNCEAQNNDTPGYPIPKRGTYYAARDEFSIPVTEEINKEVFDVCNLSTGVLNKSRTEGRMEQAKDTAFRLQRKGMSLRDIARWLMSAYPPCRNGSQSRR